MLGHRSKLRVKRTLKNLQLKPIYHAFFDSGATQTMKTNQIAELKQQIPTFSNPANQMSSTKQRNLNMLVVMLAATVSVYKLSSSNLQKFLVREYYVTFTLNFTFTTIINLLDLSYVIILLYIISVTGSDHGEANVVLHPTESSQPSVIPDSPARPGE